MIDVAKAGSDQESFTNLDFRQLHVLQDPITDKYEFTLSGPLPQDKIYSKGGRLTSSNKQVIWFFSESLLR